MGTAKQKGTGQGTRNGWTTERFDRSELMTRPATVDDATVHLVVEIGEAQLACGAGAADVCRAMCLEGA